MIEAAIDFGAVASLYENILERFFGALDTPDHSNLNNFEVKDEGSNGNGDGNGSGNGEEREKRTRIKNGRRVEVKPFGKYWWKHPEQLVLPGILMGALFWGASQVLRSGGGSMINAASGGTVSKLKPRHDRGFRLA